ncbi:MAG: bifunctional pyr operon transcriptional regulator/uracil phosphoribosyltransferase PyrR [Deltaproteobacteria bacterium]|nr:bifunctional pyr operon transcriptional regulator/uracil phosphoribosyltransferase PyrR [Deltaproteobacteria bacterium]
MSKKDRELENFVERRPIADAPGIQRVLRRLASEIVEKEDGVEDLVLVGIRTGGVHLADRMAKLIGEIEGQEVPQGQVDITLYRDDVLRGLPRPEIGPTSLPFRLSKKKVVLIDDVLYTGRTIRAALDAINDYGRPRRVRLAVLIDRGHRELPIQADYVGLRVDTEQNQSVKVELAERGMTDRIVLYELQAEEGEQS